MKYEDENDVKQKLKDYEYFKRNVLDIHGELDNISRQLSEIANSDDYLESLDFFFGHYFPTKYGQECSRFLFNVLAQSKVTIKILTENKVLDSVNKAELDLMAYRHNELIKKLSTSFEHPYSLMSTSCVTNGEGEYLLSLKRLDGQAINIFLDISQCYKLVNNLLEATIEYLPEEDNEIEPQIMNNFFSLYGKIKEINQNK
ncbi:TPA: hypothetical protein ACGXP4_004299 [Bacillus cereus]